MITAFDRTEPIVSPAVEMELAGMQANHDLNKFYLALEIALRL